MDKQVFIFSEVVPVRLPQHLDHPTVIHPTDTVMIREKFYRVLGSPAAFMCRSQGKTLRGWKFDAKEITNEETIKALREHQIACLVLHPDLVEEVKRIKGNAR